MIQLFEKGAYLVNGTELIAENEENKRLILRHTEQINYMMHIWKFASHVVSLNKN